MANPISEWETIDPSNEWETVDSDWEEVSASTRPPFGFAPGMELDLEGFGKRDEPEPKSFMEMGRDLSGAIVEAPKAITAGLERAAGTVGTGLTYMGDVMEDPTRRMIAKAAPGTALIQFITDKYGISKALKKQGKHVEDVWNDMANKGWEAPDPELMEQKWNRPLQYGSRIIFENAPTYIGAIGAGYATGSPTLGLTILGAFEKLNSYSAQRGKGGSFAKSDMISSLSGAWEAVTELIPFNYLLKGVGGKPVKALIGAGLEGFQELIAGMGQNILEYFGYSVKDWESIPGAVKEGFKHMMDNWLENVVAGVGMGGIGGALLGGAIANKVSPKTMPVVDTTITTKDVVDTKTPINIYKTVSDSRTGITEAEVKRDGDRYVDSVTGEDVVLDAEASGSAVTPTEAKGATFPVTEAGVDVGERTTEQGKGPGLDRAMMAMVDEGVSVEDAQTVMRGSQEGGKPIEDITESIETRKKLAEVQDAIEIDENDPASLEVEDKMDEPQFGEPGMISSWLTSKRILMQRIGADVLTDRLLTAKERMLVIKGTLNKEVNKVIKALRKQASLGDRVASKIMKRQTKPVRKMVNLLDTYERLPETIALELTKTEVEAFNTLRDMTKWLLDRTNVARRQAGLPLINDLTSYIPHWLDSVANDVIDGTYMYKTGYIARLMKGLPRVIKNRTALHREIKGKIQANMEQDLGRLMKGLIAYDLHDMFLTNPQQQVWDELLQLQKDDKISDSTFNAIAAFIDYDILSKQAKLDKVFNAAPGVTTTTELINKVLRPLNREITDPAKFYFGGMRKIMHAAFMPFRPRPATRNLGQRLLNLTFFRARDLLRAQFGKQDKIIHPKTGKRIKILDYIREQDWYKLTKPEDILNDASLLSRLTRLGMIGFKTAHVGNRYVSNVEVSALTAYYDWKYRFTESHNQKSKYYKRIAEHSKQTGIPTTQLQTQQADMMNDIRDGVQMTQWEYISHGMPTLFRGQTARGIAAYQSWWMNYFMSHTAEGWNRMMTGRTRVRGDGTGGRLLTRGARYRAVKGMGAIYGMARIAKKTLGIAMLGALWMPDPTNGLPPILNLATIMARLMLGFDEPEKKKQAWKDLKKNIYRLLPFNNAARDIAKVGNDWTLKDYIFYTDNEKWRQLWIPITEPKKKKKGSGF